MKTIGEQMATESFLEDMVLDTEEKCENMLKAIEHYDQRGGIKSTDDCDIPILTAEEARASFKNMGYNVGDD